MSELTPGFSRHFLTPAEPKTRAQSVRLCAAYLLWAILVPLCALLIVESLNQHSVFAAVLWAADSPAITAWSYALLTIWFCAMLSLFGRLRPAALLTLLPSFVLATINHYMFELKGEALLPRDFLNYRAGMDIMLNMTISISLTLGIAALILLLAIWRVVTLRLRPIRLRLWLRLILSCALLALLCLQVMGTWSVRKPFPDLRDDLEPLANNVQDYRRQGMLLSMSRQLSALLIMEPRAYSRRAVDMLTEQDLSAYTPENVPTKPHIIVIMGEAWSDTRLLNRHVVMDEDPFAPLRDIPTGTSHLGGLLVSIYGGSTANTEFEFLTASSLAHLPLGTIPFQHYIRRDTQSLARTLKSMGYQATGVHPYTGTFWHRDTVYPMLGFDSFHPIDEFEDPDLKFAYISDEQLGHKMLSLFEQREKDTPMFMMAVTMQNHGNYRNDKTARDFPVRIEDQDASDMDLMELKTHTAGVYDTSTLVRNIVNYFGARGEPALVVAFGDHHPRIGIAADSPSDPGAPADEGELLRDHYTTPLFIWSNYEAEDTVPDIISANFLAAQVMRWAGLNAPPVYTLSYQANQQIKAMNPYLLIDTSDTLYPAPGTVRNLAISDWLKQMRLIQYDNLFGKQYGQPLYE